MSFLIIPCLCREIEQLQDTLLSSHCQVQELKGSVESLRDQLNSMSSAVAEANQSAADAGREAGHARATLAASELMLAETRRAMQGALEDAEQWRERTEALAEKHEKLSRVMQVGFMKLWLNNEKGDLAHLDIVHLGKVHLGIRSCPRRLSEPSRKSSLHIDLYSTTPPDHPVSPQCRRRSRGAP